MNSAGNDQFRRRPFWGAVDFSGHPSPEWFQHFPDPKAIFCSLGGVLLSVPQISTSILPRSGIESPHLFIVGDVWLHNREELLSSLSETAIDPQSSDLQFAVAAYQKWGDDAGSFLAGDFAFAVWDCGHNRLFCCRDHLAVQPFFYSFTFPRFLFASDPRTILSSPGFPRKLNYRKFAGTVAYNGHLGHPEETFHQGIYSLPGGTSLTVDRRGIQKNRFWRPKIRPGLVPRKPEEAFGALRELVFRAIDSRLPEDGSTAAVHLSGGLDSSSITSVAAKCLEKKGRSLLALAGVTPAKTGEPTIDERQFIDEFRGWSNVRIEYVSAPGKGPFDDIDDSQSFAATPLRNPFTYLKLALAEAGVLGGANTVMNGICGEFGPTSRGERYLLELLLSLRFPTLIHELRGLERIRGIRPLQYLRGRVMDPLRQLRHSDPDPYVLLTSDFRKHGEPRGGIRYSGISQRGLQQAQIEYWLSKHGDTFVRPANQLLRTTFPWMDKRIVEFCLSAPSSLKVRDGHERYLLRAALDGILPPKLQWRTSKSPFSPDYNARFNTQLERARRFVSEIGASDPVRAIVDVDRLSQFLVPIDPNVRSKTARDVVPSTIYAICFLRQFPEFRR